MLLRHRRIFALLAFCLLAAPLVVGLVAPDSPATVLREGRSLAPAPRLPTTGASWLALPAAVDAYLKDHFGLRQKLITAHRELTKPMLGFGNDSVLVGRDGRMFYLGEERCVKAPAFSSATRGWPTLRTMLARYEERASSGAGSASWSRRRPNGATDLPGRPAAIGRRTPGKPTEYDLFLEGLAAKGRQDRRPAAGNQERAGRRAGFLHAR